MPDDKEFRYACVITAGELDPNWYGHSLKNDLYHVLVFFTIAHFSDKAHIKLKDIYRYRGKHIK